VKGTRYYDVPDFTTSTYDGKSPTPEEQVLGEYQTNDAWTTTFYENNDEHFAECSDSQKASKWAYEWKHLE
jgi:hypothetical protein